MQIRHNEFIIPFNEVTLKISSNFDSGNLQQAKLNQDKLILTPALDPMHPQYSTKQSSKTFFHFKIGASDTVTLNIVITRMNILSFFSSDQIFEELYRVCICRRQKNARSQIECYQKRRMDGMRRVEIDGNYELHFSLTINAEQDIYLAYHYPYSYQKSLLFLREIKQKVSNLNVLHNNEIYFTNELLIQSLERRSVNLLTLTNNNQMFEEEESRISKSFFPYHQMEGRPKKFNKPYVLFTCRVHPGQTSSSFTLEGIINFLLSNDPRANILLKNFVFLFIPLVNPDGVFHGTYRMDTQGHNLNRFYNSAQSHKQPSIFAIQTLVGYYSSRIIFFMDLHSHPHPNKGAFIYGNCLEQIQEQTETQLFAKLLSLQSQSFGYQWSSFSNSQMNSRDTNELLTKDGSARVQIYKVLGIPFAYTMQVGYHGCPLPERQEQAGVSKIDYKRTQKIFTIEDYQQHGSSILVVFFKMFAMGSRSGAKQEMSKLFQQYREQVCRDLVDKEERFRQLDGLVFKKIKNINELIVQQYYQPFFKRYHFIQASFDKFNLTSTNKQTQIEPIDASKRKEIKKKEFSFNFSSISKTIDFSPVKEKQFVIKSFKSTIEPRQSNNLPSVDSAIIMKHHQRFKFAKQLNLNFNPFPATERRKIYNLIGNQRSVIKKNIVNRLDLLSKENVQDDSDYIASQIQSAEQSFKSLQKDQFRKNILQNYFARLDEGVNREQRDNYNDETWEISSKDEDHFVLPKIPKKAERKDRNFNLEAQLQRQNDQKYRLNQHKDYTPVNIRTSLRNNGLRMRSLIKSNK